MEHTGYNMEDHALSCDTCYKWATSGNYGNEPTCPKGRDIRADARYMHAAFYKYGQTTTN